MKIEPNELEKILKNADDLLSDAQILFANERYKRSLALSFTALEEYVKIELIMENPDQLNIKHWMREEKVKEKLNQFKDQAVAESKKEDATTVSGAIGKVAYILIAGITDMLISIDFMTARNETLYQDYGKRRIDDSERKWFYIGFTGAVKKYGDSTRAKVQSLKSSERQSC